MKAIKEKHQQCTKNKETQARIAIQEKEDHETMAKGNIPRKMKDTIRNESRDEAKK